MCVYIYMHVTQIRQTLLCRLVDQFQKLDLLANNRLISRGYTALRPLFPRMERLLITPHAAPLKLA